MVSLLGLAVLFGSLLWLVLAAMSVEQALRRGAPRLLSRRARATAIVAALSCTALPAASLGIQLVASKDGTLQAGANWARNQGFGSIVDRLERWHYAEPPSIVPATALPLAVVTTTTVSAPPDPATTVPEGPSSTAVPFAPADLIPALGSPLPGEGQWVPLGVPGVDDALWATSMRPVRSAASVTATYVYIRRDLVAARMYGGTELPGGDGWEYFAKVDGSDRQTLVAAFNGGFRFEHIDGGYMTEGRTIEPLVDGEATIGIDRDGRITVGQYGRDLRDDGTWVSLRQGLPLLVDGGESMAATRYDTAWGVDFGSETYTNRSALCQLASGDLLYVMAGPVDATMFAGLLVDAGCVVAMQLDINGTWPQFAFYEGFGTDERTPVLVDDRMRNPYRYLKGTEKDFFALFPAG
ncbi:MAG: hypothetical protein RLY45_37 [Actinomycetota bacterium]